MGNKVVRSEGLG